MEASEPIKVCSKCKKLRKETDICLDCKENICYSCIRELAKIRKNSKGIIKYAKLCRACVEKRDDT